MFQFLRPLFFSRPHSLFCLDNDWFFVECSNGSYIVNRLCKQLKPKRLKSIFVENMSQKQMRMILGSSEETLHLNAPCIKIYWQNWLLPKKKRLLRRATGLQKNTFQVKVWGGIALVVSMYAYFRVRFGFASLKWQDRLHSVYSFTWAVIAFCRHLLRKKGLFSQNPIFIVYLSKGRTLSLLFDRKRLVYVRSDSEARTAQSALLDASNTMLYAAREKNVFLHSGFLISERDDVTQLFQERSASVSSFTLLGKFTSEDLVVQIARFLDQGGWLPFFSVSRYFFFNKIRRLPLGKRRFYIWLSTLFFFSFALHHFILQSLLWPKNFSKVSQIRPVQKKHVSPFNLFKKVGSALKVSRFKLQQMYWTQEEKPTLMIVFAETRKINQRQALYRLGALLERLKMIVPHASLDVPYSYLGDLVTEKKGQSFALLLKRRVSSFKEAEKLTCVRLFCP